MTKKLLLKRSIGSTVSFPTLETLTRHTLDVRNKWHKIFTSLPEKDGTRKKKVICECDDLCTFNRGADSTAFPSASSQPEKVFQQMNFANFGDFPGTICCSREHNLYDLMYRPIFFK